MVEDSNEKLEKRFERRDFLRLLAAGALGAAASCVPIDQDVVQSGFPAQKAYNVSTEKKLTHSDKVVEAYFGFSSNDITSKKELKGDQVVARLRQMPKKYEGRTVLVTVTKEGDSGVLNYIFEGDRVAFKEVAYQSNASFKDTNRRGVLFARKYENKNGRVRQPLPAGYMPEVSKNPLQWSVVLTLHNYLQREFQESIFSEDDVKEAEYHMSPKPFLNSIEKDIDELGLDDDYETVKEAGDHSNKTKNFKEIVQRYTRITQNPHEEKEINDWVDSIKERLKRSYNNLVKIKDQSAGEKREYLDKTLSEIRYNLE